jgi:uncharacterized phage protein (TIGR01671 family)
MKELKFRVWVQEDDCMYRPDDFHLEANDHPEWIDGGNGVEAGLVELYRLMELGKFKVFSHLAEFFEEKMHYHRDEKGKIAKDLSMIPVFGNERVKDAVLMQFVGIVDNDGADVYEGDIVLTPDCGDVFDDWIVVSNIEYGGYALKSPQNEDYLEFIGDFIHDMKVIGNIWENPDLLKEAE